MLDATVGRQLTTFNKQDNFHFESRRTPLAAAAFKAYPSTSEFVLTNEETRFMVAHATANNPKEMPSLCSCGKPLDLSHCTSCGPNQLTRHNRVQARFVAMAREQGCVTEQNQRHTIDDAKTQLNSNLTLSSALVLAQLWRRTLPSSTRMRRLMWPAQLIQSQGQR